MELGENVITGEPTIEKLEEAYERGYAAVIQDGILIGFINERPSDACDTKGRKIGHPRRSAGHDYFIKY